MILGLSGVRVERVGMGGRHLYQSMCEVQAMWWEEVDGRLKREIEQESAYLCKYWRPDAMGSLA
jgi:hypothetical protein